MPADPRDEVEWMVRRLRGQNSDPGTETLCDDAADVLTELREKLEAAEAEAQRRYRDGWQHGFDSARAEGAALWLAGRDAAAWHYQTRLNLPATGEVFNSFRRQMPPADLTAALAEHDKRVRDAALEEVMVIAKAGCPLRPVEGWSHEEATAYQSGQVDAEIWFQDRICALKKGHANGN